MDLTLAVCIPCVYKHLPLLYTCLNSIYNQILLPNEIVISISSVPEDFESSLELQKLKELAYVKVIYTTENKYAGENRGKFGVV